MSLMSMSLCRTQEGITLLVLGQDTLQTGQIVILEPERRTNLPVAFALLPSISGTDVILTDYTPLSGGVLKRVTEVGGKKIRWPRTDAEFSEDDVVEFLDAFLPAEIASSVVSRVRKYWRLGPAVPMESEVVQHMNEILSFLRSDPLTSELDWVKDLSVEGGNLNFWLSEEELASLHKSIMDSYGEWDEALGLKLVEITTFLFGNS